MTDIVERLRDPRSRWVALSEPDPLRLEAADEIERLQAEKDKLRAYVETVVAKLSAALEPQP